MDTLLDDKGKDKVTNSLQVKNSLKIPDFCCKGLRKHPGKCPMFLLV